MTRTIVGVAALAVACHALAAGAAPPATPVAERVRGTIASVGATSLAIRTRTGALVRLALPAEAVVIALSPGRFADIVFGTYVGAVAMRLEAYPPQVRDSRSWLHRATELRIAGEELRGLALGYFPWDAPPGSTISHGWVDDIEERILSIKFGPTDDDETDVDVPADVPVQRMSIGPRTLLKPGARVVAVARRTGAATRAATEVYVGRDGAVPSL